MLKSIAQKEWLKTRWFLLLFNVILLGYSAFLMIRMHRAMEIKGAEHIWQVMLLRDAIIVDSLSILPMFIGVVLALVQMMPEMQRKCLKLTLHLPCSRLKTTSSMLFYGVVALAFCFALCLLLLYVSMRSVIAPEMVRHVLLTTLPWVMAGITAYLLTAWICIEPTWKRRVLNLVLTAMLLRVFFLSNTPESYNSFLPILCVVGLLTCCLVWLSVLRFIDGLQD